jgi:hypothetical protein
LLDCDDICYLNKIDKNVLFLESGPDYGFISTLSYKIDDNDNIVTIWHELPPIRMDSFHDFEKQANPQFYRASQNSLL